jgi:hypothetical protein
MKQTNKMLLYHSENCTVCMKNDNVNSSTYEYYIKCCTMRYKRSPAALYILTPSSNIKILNPIRAHQSSVLAKPEFLADLPPPSIDRRALRRFRRPIIQALPSSLQSLKKHTSIKETIYETSLVIYPAMITEQTYSLPIPHHH